MIITHYIPSIDRTSGGVGAYMQLLAKELGQMVELHVVTHRSGNMLEIPHAQVHYIAGGVRHLMQAKAQWCKLLDELKPDMVHVNCCWMPGSALTQRWAQQKGYKVVLTPHGMLEPWIIKRHYWSRKLPALLLYQREAVRKADMLHATAESERQNLLRLGYNSRVTVIANGVDVDSIGIKKSWRRNREILFLSRVHVKKGINFLIEAVAMLKDCLQGYTVRIAGEGEPSYIRELMALCERLGMQDTVRFEGGVYGDRKWQLFRQADLFVLPTHSENFGIVVAEALASGTPVITTTGTPWAELDTAGCGWCTAIGTGPAVKALRAFLSLSEDELQAMGLNGRRLVEEKYSARKVAGDMVAMYQRISGL